jgi:hypothetical protein
VEKLWESGQSGLALRKTGENLNHEDTEMHRGIVLWFGLWAFAYYKETAAVVSCFPFLKVFTRTLTSAQGLRPTINEYSTILTYK